MEPVKFRTPAGEVVVDSAPLRALATRYETLRVARPTAHSLILQPHQRTLQVTGLVIVLAGLASLPDILRLVAPSGPDAQPGALLAGIFIVAVSLVVLSRCRWYEFNRATRQMTEYSPFHRKTRPLANLLALQIIDSGGHARARGEAGRPSYQVNLILDDPAQPRLNIAFNQNLGASQQAAEAAGKFLSVPVLGRAPEEPPARRRP